jgi:hypothetical protein
VPAWAKALLVLRTVISPLVDRGALENAAEADRLFLADIDDRGVEEASAPVGAGGEAARRDRASA